MGGVGGESNSVDENEWERMKMPAKSKSILIFFYTAYGPLCRKSRIKIMTRGNFQKLRAS